MKITGIDPTFSFLRIMHTVASNSFFALELGPQSRKFEPMAAELADNRRKRDNFVDEFDAIIGHDKFSEQEKNIAKALSATFNHKYKGGILELCGSEWNKNSWKAELFVKWYQNYCAVANNRPHLDHFRKMVKNFRRHVQRFLSED